MFSGPGRGRRLDGLDMVNGLWVMLEMLDFGLKVLPGGGGDWSIFLFSFSLL